MADNQAKKDRLANLLREYMRQENLSGRKLAQRLKLSQPTVLAYLDGVTFPSEETRQRIAEVLGLTLAEVDARLEDSPVQPQITVSLLKQEIRALNREDFAQVAQVVFDRLLAELETSP